MLKRNPIDSFSPPIRSTHNYCTICFYEKNLIHMNNVVLCESCFNTVQKMAFDGPMIISKSKDESSFDIKKSFYKNLDSKNH